MGTTLHLKFNATGHQEILSSHPSTIEITKDAHLSARGDCVIGVNCDIGPFEIPEELKSELRNPGSIIRVSLKADKFLFVVQGHGDTRLTLSHPSDFVIRKSGFLSDRTLMIGADKAAIDMPRAMVQLLRNPEQIMTIEISI